MNAKFENLEANENLNAFKKLRNYYRNNFANGKSDASFILWIETMLTELREQEIESALEKKQRKFRHLITNEIVTPETWQTNLAKGDFYVIENPPLGVAGLDPHDTQIFDMKNFTVYGQILTKRKDGFFIARAFNFGYSTQHG